MVAVILVDLDDTLFDRGAAFGRWAERFVAARPAAFPVARRVDDLAALAALDDRGRAPRRAVARAIVARFALDDDPGRLAARLPAEVAACVEPEAGVAEAVAALARRAPLVVVTNGGGTAQRAKLARLGLTGAFAAVVVSAEVGVAKPDVRIFQRALALAGAGAGDAVMIGDDPALDLAPARALGMTTVWIDRATGGTLPAAVAAVTAVTRAA